MAREDDKFYEMTDEAKEIKIRSGETIKVWRIRKRETGELGGWIKGEYCLAQDGSWVGGDAVVIGGYISGESEVRDNAFVGGGYIKNGTVVSGHASVRGGGIICDNSAIDGYAQIMCFMYLDVGISIKNAKIGGNAVLDGDQIEIKSEISDGIEISGNTRISSNVHIYGDDITIKSGEIYSCSSGGRGEW